MSKAPNEELEKVRANVRNLREQNAELQDRLDHAVAKIMELQGGRDQITDGNVKKQFEALYRAIQDWVTEIELDLMQQSRHFGMHIFRDIIARQPDDGLLRHLSFRQKDESFEAEGRWDFHNEDYRMMLWLSTLDTCLHVILCRYVWSFLERYVFSRRYPLGLPSDPRKGIWYIHDAVKGGNDGDSEPLVERQHRADEWKAEALATLIATKRFQEDKTMRMEELRRDLRDYLVRLIDSATLDKHLQTFQRNGLYPAVELNEKIECSTVKYDIEDFNLPLHSTVREDPSLNNCILKDVAEWRDWDTAETFGSIFGNLFPGVSRVGSIGERNLPLVKPVVLVLSKESMEWFHNFKEDHNRSQQPRHKSPARLSSVSPSPSNTPRRSTNSKPSSDRHRAHKRDKREKSPTQTSGLARIRRWGFSKSEKPTDERSNSEGFKTRIPRSRTADLLTRSPNTRREPERRRSLRDPSAIPMSHEPSLARSYSRAPDDHSELRRQSIHHEYWEEHRDEIDAVPTIEQRSPVPTDAGPAYPHSDAEGQSSSESDGPYDRLQYPPRQTSVRQTPSPYSEIVFSPELQHGLRRASHTWN